MKSWIFMGAVGIATVLLTACGGGGGSGGPAGFNQTFTTSAAIGELIEYSVDTQNLTYTYKVTKSQYGCEVITATCHKGSGTLIKNEDGSFTPSGASTSKIYALQNGLLIGTVKLGSLPETPIIGVSKPSETSSDIAGTYNYISVQCPNKSNGAFSNCDSYYGSLKVTAVTATSATYTTCEAKDISLTTPNCTGTTTGNVSHTGGGVWKFIKDGSVNENYLVAFKSPNGQKVGFIDFNDQGGYGFGQATISEKIALTPTDRDNNVGKWFLANISPGGNGGTQVVTVASDGTPSSGGTFSPNTPWDGFITNSNDPNGKFIMAGNGVFIYGGWKDRSNNAKYMIGMKM